ncbi:unnamed protein product [Adineta steineri]|uniref:Uncharacterized protein n=1 Tax=Adineta steineri TaxID=433720 RepID=A0A813SG49_9BILA|nr:unnamed protein product [Adineta steineri]
MKNKIDKLELENIFVTNYGRDIPKRDIISQLNNTVKSVGNLIIEYTFTKPLEKFQSKLFNAIKETHSRLIFKIRPAEVTSSLELTGTNEAGFTLSIKSHDETDSVKYSSSINSMFDELKISTLHLHNAILSKSLWNTIRQLIVDSQNLKEMIMDCPSTLNETHEWLFSLCKNESLKILHIMNGPKQANVCIEIFQMLKEKNTLEKFSLTSSTYRLQLDFISASSQNRYSTLTGSAKWCTNNNSDVLIIKKFLQIIPVHHLSLDLTNINCETSLTQLAETINQLPLLKILELRNLKDPVNDEFWSHVFNLQKLRILTFYADKQYDHPENELQLLLNRMPNLHTLELCLDEDEIEYKLFSNLKHDSIRCLDFAHYTFNREECEILIHIQLGQKCGVLMLSIKHLDDILQLINQLRNLRSLKIRLLQDKDSLLISSENELNDWLTLHLPSICDFRIYHDSMDIFSRYHFFYVWIR